MSIPVTTFLDPVGTAIAQVQAQVGAFLQLKAKLLPLTESTDPATRQAAQQMMAQQVQLEGQLPGVLSVAQNLSPGGVLSSDAVGVATFGAMMMEHVRQVEAFVGPANVTAANQALLPGLGLTNVQFLIGLGILGTGLILGKPLIGIGVAGAAYVYARS